MNLFDFEKLDCFLRQAHTQNESKYWRLSEKKEKKKERGGAKIWQLIYLY